MLMANAQKKWQVFNLKTGKWNKLKKGAFKAEVAKGNIIRIVQPNGGFATIANANGTSFSSFVRELLYDT